MMKENMTAMIDEHDSEHLTVTPIASCSSYLSIYLSEFWKISVGAIYSINGSDWIGNGTE